MLRNLVLAGCGVALAVPVFAQGRQAPAAEAGPAGGGALPAGDHGRRPRARRPAGRPADEPAAAAGDAPDDAHGRRRARQGLPPRGLRRLLRRRRARHAAERDVVVAHARPHRRRRGRRHRGAEGPPEDGDGPGPAAGRSTRPSGSSNCSSARRPAWRTPSGRRARRPARARRPSSPRRRPQGAAPAGTARRRADRGVRPPRVAGEDESRPTPTPTP